MNISDWSDDRIMQLPDEAFGQQYIIGVGNQSAGSNEMYLAATEPLPQRFVVWGAIFQGVTISDDAFLSMGLWIGDSVPDNVNDLVLLQRALKGWSVPNVPVDFIGRNSISNSIIPMRMMVHAEGSKLILYATILPSGGGFVRAGLIISTVPTDVPSWLAKL